MLSIEFEAEKCISIFLGSRALSLSCSSADALVAGGEIPIPRILCFGVVHSSEKIPSSTLVFMQDRNAAETIIRHLSLAN